MKVIKLFIFVFSLFLINYVGGIPTDLKNLFIAHFIFLVPLMLELYSHMNVKLNKLQHYTAIFIFASTCIVLVIIFLGIGNIVKLNGDFLVFNKEFLLHFPVQITIYSFIRFSTIVYVVSFAYTMLFSHLLELTKQPPTQEELIS